LSLRRKTAVGGKTAVGAETYRKISVYKGLNFWDKCSIENPCCKIEKNLENLEKLKK
jgi:hypothetical protein